MDDGGGAEADETEIQGQEYYKQDSYDDDLDGQISEATEEDLSHYELKMEEQEQPDKVALFEWVNIKPLLNCMRNNFPLVSTVDSTPWNPIDFGGL